MRSLTRPLLAIVCAFTIAGAGGKQLTVEDIWGGMTFSGRSVRGIQWMKDGRSYSMMEFDSVSKSTAIIAVNAKDRSRRTVVTGADLKVLPEDPPFSFSSYQWSPDGKRILFVSAPPRKQYLSRLTPAGNFYVYDVMSKAFTRVTDVTVPQYNQKFSPDGSMIGFVRENDLYLYDIASANLTRVTYDGSADIINGRFDWVYEEEFGIADGWRWSPDGRTVAFWRLDQSAVPSYTMTEWDSTHLNLVTMRYPKPGDRNASVKIGVYDLGTKRTDWLDTGAEEDIYIPRIAWTGQKDRLTVQRLNRAQNTLEMLLFDTEKGTSSVLLTERSDAWVEVHDDLRFLKDGSFVWTSERDGYNHLYHVSADGGTVRQLTKGQWDVDAFYGIDEKKGLLYFTSSEVSPMERHVYTVSIDGKRKARLSKLPGTHSLNASPTFDNLIGYHSSTSVPTQVRMMAPDGKELYMMEANDMPILKQYDLPAVRFLSFRTSDGTALNGCMMTPADFDSTRRYPVMVYTYGGPGSQVVRDQWGGATYLWHAMLTQKGYIVFMVDNRGTGARGAAFKKVTHRNLGKWEVNDQVEGATYLGTLPYVDRDRIGIWGWSYGGYLASQTILVGADHFRAAIAVAPVTHWKFYDTIYAERYMGTPSDNPEGYAESAPVTHAGALKGRFLLVHGTSDDNVHFQNAAVLAAALQKENKPFETMFYPNKNHGIGGGKTRVHLYNMMTDFILRNL